MLTYNRGIYKKILEPLNVRYYIPSDNAGKGFFVKPSTREDVWEFVFPVKLRNSISLSRSSFSAMNQGKSDIKNSTDSARERMKRVLLTEGNEYFTVMGKHLRDIILENAAIAVYVGKTGKDLKFYELSQKGLDIFYENNREEVKEENRRMLISLSGLLSAIWDEIKADKRFEEGFFEYLRTMNDIAPVTVLEFLCISSLFYLDDKDAGFYKIIENHYQSIAVSESRSRDTGGKNNMGSRSAVKECFHNDPQRSGVVKEAKSEPKTREVIDDLFDMINGAMVHPEGSGKTPNAEEDRKIKSDSGTQFDSLMNHLSKIAEKSLK